MSLKKWLRGGNLFYADLVLIVVAAIGSFALRLNLEQFIYDYLPTLFWMVAVALLIKPWVYRRYGLYQRVWAYASIEEMKLIVQAVSMASALVTIAMVALFVLGVFARLPRSVFIIDWMTSLAVVGALRFSLRLLAEENAGDNGETQHSAVRGVLIIGAGDAGALVVREMQKNPQLGLAPVAFLDDDTDKHGHQIHGVRVEGGLGALPEQLKKPAVDEVVMAIPSAPGSVLRKVAEMCRQQNVPFRTMPGIYELIGGSVNVNRLRKVDIADLLRRQPAKIDRERVGANLRGKRVLVTGAGGSIASELCRQVARWKPAQIVLLGHGENSVFDILLELNSDFTDLDLQPVIADVRNVSRLGQIVARYRPDVIFHAAAHKHVPLMEINAVEAVTNNILGTRNVVAAALENAVERLVMISTDKAVQPSSVMGATKRIAEWIVMDAAASHGKAYSVVRFGNVLGSRGSIVPLFEQQIAKGGPLTITHPEMERYFMTIPEAVHLVLQASSFDEGGELYMLDMGEPVRIIDLAEDLIRLSGLEPGEDIEIVFKGLRPGEKLREELWEPGAEYQPTEHPDIRRVRVASTLAAGDLQAAVTRLADLAEAGDEAAILKALAALLPDSEFAQAPPPDLTSVV
jgi:FlaA1/EpsC-like NDP-sugar epimerase